VFKGIGILVKVIITLLNIQSYDLIIIQNPPCLPAVLAASLVSILNGSVIIIDWHNLGFKMFEERLGSKHMLVKLAFKLERAICGLAHKHICVSTAMKVWLKEHFSVNATVLYDRPAKLFTREAPSLQQRHKLFSKLDYRDEILFPTLNINLNESNISSNDSIQTAVTTIQTISQENSNRTDKNRTTIDKVAEGVVKLRADRAKLIGIYIYKCMNIYVYICGYTYVYAYI
jgi:hypothetical protein